MFGEAWDEFKNSFLKSALKPNSNAWFGSPFQADNAFGANMVPGSEKRNPWPMRDASNAGYGWQSLLGLMGGGKTTGPMSALSSSGSPLTIPAGSQFSEMAPTLSNVPTTDIPFNPMGANLGLGMGSALLQRLFPSSSPYVDVAGGAAKTGVDVMGTMSGNPMSAISLPFDLMKNVKSIARLFV